MLAELLLSASALTPLPLEVNHYPLQLLMFPRSPNQMVAFYTGRKFPAEMIDILEQQCFVTIGIHNRGLNKLWLNLENWEFEHDGKPLQRLDRQYWLNRWSDMGMPQAKISTFRWTLIPEKLDYLPGEQEGGNIILPRVKGPVTLRAKFKIGENQEMKPLRIEFDQLFCAENRE
ncbi:MAG: hypothetical protein ACWA5Q_00910 [bacterium]